MSHPYFETEDFKQACRDDFRDSRNGKTLAEFMNTYPHCVMSPERKAFYRKAVGDGLK